MKVSIVKEGICKIVTFISAWGTRIEVGTAVSKDVLVLIGLVRWSGRASLSKQKQSATDVNAKHVRTKGLSAKEFGTESASLLH